MVRIYYLASKFLGGGVKVGDRVGLADAIGKSGTEPEQHRCIIFLHQQIGP